MKTLIRAYLINTGALWVTTRLLPAFVISGGAKGWLIGGLAFMVLNIVLVPFLKILLLPLNLLTLGVFAWLSNVLALYFLATVLPDFKILPYNFPGMNLGGIIIPAFALSAFMVAVAASFLIGFIIHFAHWLIK